jgi:hypothetical protein
VSPLGSGVAPYAFSPAPDGQGVYAVQRWAKGAPRLYYRASGDAKWSVLWTGHGITATHAVAAAGASTLFYAAGNEGRST